MVGRVVLVVRYEQYGAVCELALLTLGSVEKVLGSQPVLSSGGAGAGTHFNSALVRGERGGEIQIIKDLNLIDAGTSGENNTQNKN